MVTKKLSRKDKSFGQLVYYMSGQKMGEPVFYCPLDREYHFGRSETTPSQVIEKYLKNAEFAKKRSNGNYIYHEILSFHPKDKEKLTWEIMKDLTCKYLDLRTRERGLGYAVIHWTDSPHVHIMLAANEFGSPKKTALQFNNTQFEQMEKAIEDYQRTRYPFLKYSLVFQGKKREKAREMVKTDAEKQRARRLGCQTLQNRTQKELVYEVVENGLSLAISREDFKKRLEAGGLELYSRGKNWGVLARNEDGKLRKFRLSTLGLGELFEKTALYWEKRPGMLQELERSRETGLRRESKRELALSKTLEIEL